MSLTDSYNHIFRVHRNAWPDFAALSARIADAIVETGDTVVASGADSVDYTLQLLKLVGETGRVLAFEPLLHIFAQLQQRLATEPLAHRVIAYQLAIADFAGTSSFVSGPELPGYSGLPQRDYRWGARTEKINVDVVTLDSFSRELEALSFIKLDLDGGEYHAMLGAVDSIKRHRPFIVFEHGGDATYWPHSYAAGDLWDFFLQFDYAFFDVLGNLIENPEDLALQQVCNYHVACRNHRRYERFCRIMNDINYGCMNGVR